MQASQMIKGMDRGPILNVLHEDGRRISVFTPTLDQGSPLSKSMANIIARLGDYAGTIETANSQFLPKARAEHLRFAAVNVLKNTFVQAQAEMRAHKQKNAIANATAREVSLATAATAPIRARSLKRWDAADLPGKMAMARDLDMEGLAAIIECGAISELPPDIREIAEDRYVVLKHIAKTGIQADFQLQPNANAPLATGPDVARAIASSETSFNELKAQSEVIATVENTMLSIVNMVALATDLPTEQAYRLLTTGNTSA